MNNRVMILVFTIVVLSFTGCGGGSSDSSPGNAPTPGSGGSLTLINAPASTGGTFIAHENGKGNVTVDPMLVGWQEGGPPASGVLHAEGLELGYVSTGSSLYITFHSQDLTLANSSLEVFNWECGSNLDCSGVTLDQTAGTVTFLNTVLSGVVTLSGSVAPQPITLNGTLNFTPSSGGVVSDTSPPTVSLVSPANGTTNVSLASAITATFSEPMLATSINSTTFVVSGVTGAVTYSGNIATFTPSSSLAANTTYNATITTGVQDVAGNTLVTDYVWTFTANMSSGTGPYLSYEAGSNIYAVDKNDPASISLITSDLLDAAGLNHTGDGVALLRPFTVDLTTKKVTIGDPELLVYIGTTKFWKVDMSEGSNLIPQPLMTETYTVLCWVEFNEDELNLEDNRIFYELPGVDNDCAQVADNTRWSMRVGKSQNYAAVDITAVTDQSLERLITVRDFLGNNSVIGYIAIVGNEIRHYNSQFLNPVVVKTVANINDWGVTRLDISEFDSDGGFMQIDNIVYWYDFQNKALSGALHTMAANTGSSQMDCDATECFFSNFAQTGSQDDFVYRIPKDGSGTSSLLATVTGGFGSSYSDAITPDFIYVAKGNDKELISIARSGGAISSVDSNVEFIMNADQKLYYNRGATAVVRGNNGAIVKEFSNAAWVGLNVVGFDEGFNLSSERYFLAERATGQTNLSNATLQSYDPVTNLKDVDLGVLPAGITGVGAIQFGSGGMLAELATDSGASDVFWINPTVANSYTRVTNDSQNEFVISLY